MFKSNIESGWKSRSDTIGRVNDLLLYTVAKPKYEADLGIYCCFELNHIRYFSFLLISGNTFIINP
jgi:hypothetical protein